MAYTFNPFTGNFDTIVKDGFLPYCHIQAGLSVTVPEYRELITTNELEVLGELVVLGTVTLLSQSIDDSADLNTYVGTNVQDILDRIFGATESTAVSYSADGTVNYLTGYSRADQVTANRIYRVDFTYDASLYPATESLKIYSLTDGTTILKTIIVSYTWSSGNLITTTQVTS